MRPNTLFKLRLSLLSLAVVALTAACSTTAATDLGDTGVSRHTSAATGTVTMVNPTNNSTVTGPFTASVTTTLSGGASPYVEYWLDDGLGNNTRYATSFNAPNFSVTITPPAHVFAWYHCTAYYYAYDSTGTPTLRLLDTDFHNIIIHTP